MVTQLVGITMPSEPLASVVSAFAHWRSHKTGSKTPADLRKQAVALRTSYSASKITKALNLSGSQFKRWCQQVETVGTPDFIHLPTPIATVRDAIPNSVEVFFNSGERLCLNGSDNAMLVSLVQALKA
jgi:hypothetical protein